MHSQTPAWFFKDGTRDLTNSPADRALLKARMEAHIKGIADHINARYPDGNSPIWAWDVVNEVIADGDNANPHDMRDSRWFQILGEGFVDQAFRLADRYFPDAALFINEYNTEMPEKRADYLELISALEARGVPIDGVGHQAHVDVARPVQWLEDSIKAVEALDPKLLQAITELDVNASTENQGADVSGAPVDPYSPRSRTRGRSGGGRLLLPRPLRHAARAQRVRRLGDLLGYQQRPHLAADLADGPALGAAAALRRRTAGHTGLLGHRRPVPASRRPADVLPPRIADQSDITAVANGASGAKVAYVLPSAIDTLDGVVPLACVPLSGSRFPIGVTTVTCTARMTPGTPGPARSTSS